MTRLTPGRASLFSIVAAIVYTLAYYLNWPLLRYYSGVGFTVTKPQAAGFAILIYGWVATAALAGLIAAALAPERWVQKLPRDTAWMTLVVLLFAVVVYEKRWFF